MTIHGFLPHAKRYPRAGVSTLIDRCMIAKIYLNDAGIQRKLLQENDLFTVMRALTIAKEAETADKNLKEMKAPTQELDFTSSNPASMKVKSEPVQKIHTKKKLSSSKGAQGGVACHRCGNPGHLATTYQFKDEGCVTSTLVWVVEHLLLLQSVNML